MMQLAKFWHPNHSRNYMIDLIYWCDTGVTTLRKIKELNLQGNEMVPVPDAPGSVTSTIKYGTSVKS